MTEHVLMTYAVRKPYGRTGVVPEDAEYDATKVPPRARGSTCRRACPQVTGTASEQGGTHDTR